MLANSMVMGEKSVKIARAGRFPSNFQGYVAAQEVDRERRNALSASCDRCRRARPDTADRRATGIAEAKIRTAHAIALVN